MKTLTIRATSLLLTVVAAVALAKQSFSSRPKNVVVPMFAVLGSERGEAASIDPMLLIDGQTIRPVPNPCTESPALHDFENRYLKPGTVYPVMFGGERRGTVSVKKLEGTNWGVRLNTDVRIQGLTMALAVGDRPNSRGGSRRNPTVTERKRIEQVAREILIGKGVPTASLARMRLNQTTAIELNHLPKLIVSAEVERTDKLGMEYSLFFVADPVSNEKSVIWFQHPQSETDAEAVYLIDHLDVDGNGADRMFVRRVFYENYRYEVYQNRGGRWLREFTSEVFGCL